MDNDKIHELIHEIWAMAESVAAMAAADLSGARPVCSSTLQVLAEKTNAAASALSELVPIKYESAA